MPVRRFSFLCAARSSASGNQSRSSAGYSGSVRSQGKEHDARCLFVRGGTKSGSIRRLNPEDKSKGRMISARQGDEVGHEPDEFWGGADSTIVSSRQRFLTGPSRAWHLGVCSGLLPCDVSNEPSAIRMRRLRAGWLS